MIQHYLKSAVTQVKRSPFTSTVNVLALALGFICFSTAIGVSRYWAMSDSHFARADRIYVVTQQFGEGGRLSGHRPLVAQPIATYLVEDFPELEAVARIGRKREWTVRANNRKATLTGARADPDLLRIFDFQFVAGDAVSALASPDNVIITSEAARKLFGNDNPLGQQIHFVGDFYPTVTGVIDAPPSPSHMANQENAFGRIDFLYAWPTELEEREWWVGVSATTYVLFPEDQTKISPEAMRPQLRGFIERRMPADQAALSATEIDVLALNGLQSRLIDLQLFEGGSKAFSIKQILAGLGFLVLLVACVNYANLATAQATSRGKEVGMRKVIGAGTPQLLQQYWLEALLLTTLAAVAGLVGLWLLAPLLEAQTGIDIRLGLFSNHRPLLLLALLVPLVALVSCLYPVVVLAKVRPVQALYHGALNTGPKLASRVLVALQFCAASTLLIVLLVINQQNRFLKQRGAANAQHDLVILTDDGSTSVGHEALRSDLASNPDILATSSIDYVPWSNHENFLSVTRKIDGTGAETIVFYNQVGHHFLEVFDGRLVAGRFFDEARNDIPSNAIFSGESEVTSVPVIIDERFAQELGFASAAAAVDRDVYLTAQFRESFGQSPTLRVIGVVEDMPLVLSASGNNANLYGLANAAWGFPLIQIKTSRRAEALAAINQALVKRDPQALIKYEFIQDAFDAGFRTFDGISSALVTLSVIALLISLMGLVGMAAFTTARRRREIGIRKTLGASAGEIVAMLLKDFSKPVVLGNIVAWPLAYYASRIYLDNFIETIDLSIVPWIVGLVLTTAVAWLAVALRSFGAARLKPVDVLRYE